MEGQTWNARVTKAIRIDAIIERKDPSLPRFVVVPSKRLKAWALQGTTPVEVVIDGISLGRRNLKRWTRDRDCWFIDLTAPMCKRANVDTGEHVRLDLKRAPEDLPAELAELIASHPAARRLWQQRSPGQQRMLTEHVRAAKQAATRTRRATRALLPAEDL